MIATIILNKISPTGEWTTVYESSFYKSKPRGRFWCLKPMQEIHQHLSPSLFSFTSSSRLPGRKAVSLWKITPPEIVPNPVKPRKIGRQKPKKHPENWGHHQSYTSFLDTHHRPYRLQWYWLRWQILFQIDLSCKKNYLLQWLWKHLIPKGDTVTDSYLTSYFIHR